MLPAESASGRLAGAAGLHRPVWLMTSEHDAEERQSGRRPNSDLPDLEDRFGDPMGLELSAFRAIVAFERGG